MKDLRTRYWLYLLLALALVRGLLYAAIIPPWQAPDETGHFEYAWLLAHLRRIPTAQDISPAFEQELLASLYEWRYGTFIGRPLPEQMPVRLNDLPNTTFARASRTVLSERFSLAYVWQALFLVPFLRQDLSLQLFIVRMSSVLINLGIVLLAFRTFRALFPRRLMLAITATATIVLIPQHTFINSTVGEGPLAEAMSCLVIYCWIRLFERGWDAWQVLGILSGTAAGIVSKNTAAFLIPMDAALALWFLCRSHLSWARRHIVYVCVGIALVGMGVWAWSHTALGARALTTIAGLSSPAQWAWTDRRGMTFGEALLATFDSFWATFGWMALPIGQRWYGAIAAISSILLCGWLVKGRERAVPWAAGIMLVALAGALLVYLWAALLSQQGTYYQFQGRYLYPAIVPLSFFLVGGMDRLRPVSQERTFMRLFLAFLLLLDAWSLYGYVLPYFYS